MGEMTSRERVLAAINRQEPDRVPLDIGGGASTGIVVEGYERLKAYLGVTGETEVLNKIFRVARLDESVTDRLGSDCRPLGIKPAANGPPPPSEEGTFTDLWGVTWRRAPYGEGCFYWELAHSPLAEATLEELESYAWPDTEDPGFVAGLAEEARALFQSTDYAIMADVGFKSFWEQAYLLRGLEQMLVDLVRDPEFAAALLDKILEINLRVTERFLEAVGPYIQVFRFTDDLATQRGPLMAPRTYRALIKPIHKRYSDFVRSRTEAKIFFHSCGNVVDLVDDLIDVGIDILNPVQVSAMGDTQALKARFGDRLAFWGGIDTQHVLPRGTAQQVAAEVRRRITDLAEGGGYVAAAVHNIQPDVPPKNVVAMAQAVREFGRYPVV